MKTIETQGIPRKPRESEGNDKKNDEGEPPEFVLALMELVQASFGIGLRTARGRRIPRRAGILFRRHASLHATRVWHQVLRCSIHGRERGGGEQGSRVWVVR